MADRTKDLFDAPIPGQALTEKLGNRPWDKPPQYVEHDQALRAIWTSLSAPEQSYRIIETLKAGVEKNQAGINVQDIAKTVLLAGVSKGKWSVDMALLMEPTVMAQVTAIAHVGGLKNVNTVPPTSKDALTAFKMELEAIEDKSKDPFAADVTGPLEEDTRPDRLRTAEERAALGADTTTSLEQMSADAAAAEIDKDPNKTDTIAQQVLQGQADAFDPFGADVTRGPTQEELLNAR